MDESFKIPSLSSSTTDIVVPEIKMSWSFFFAIIITVISVIAFFGFFWFSGINLSAGLWTDVISADWENDIKVMLADLESKEIDIKSVLNITNSSDFVNAIDINYKMIIDGNNADFKRLNVYQTINDTNNPKNFPSSILDIKQKLKTLQESNWVGTNKELFDEIKAKYDELITVYNMFFQVSKTSVNTLLQYIFDEVEACNEDRAANCPNLKQDMLPKLITIRTHVLNTFGQVIKDDYNTLTKVVEAGNNIKKFTEIVEYLKSGGGIPVPDALKASNFEFFENFGHSSKHLIITPEEKQWILKNMKRKIMIPRMKI